MPYKVNNKKQPDGTYLLSYGRGKKKITDTLVKLPADHDQLPGKWFAGHQGPFDTMKEAKKGWGEWAEKAYDEDGGEVDSVEESRGSAGDQPSRPKKPGPPKYKPKSGPPSYKPKGGPPPHKRSTPPESLGFNFQHDPFDPRFRSENRELTPLGLLVEIEQWCRRYEDRIAKINTKLAENEPPGWNPFDVLIADVRATIARECPDLIKENGSVESPAEAHAREQAERTSKLTPENLRAQLDRPRQTDGIPEGFDPDDIPF